MAYFYDNYSPLTVCIIVVIALIIIFFIGWAIWYSKNASSGSSDSNGGNGNGTGAGAGNVNSNGNGGKVIVVEEINAPKKDKKKDEKHKKDDETSGFSMTDDECSSDFSH